MVLVHFVRGTFYPIGTRVHAGGQILGGTCDPMTKSFPENAERDWVGNAKLPNA